MYAKQAKIKHDKTIQRKQRRQESRPQKAQTCNAYADALSLYLNIFALANNTLARLLQFYHCASCPYMFNDT